MQGNFTGFLAYAHIAARQLGFAGLDELENIFDVSGIVAEGNLVEMCLSRAQNDEVPERIERLPNNRQSFRAFGMPVPQYDDASGDRQGEVPCAPLLENASIFVSLKTRSALTVLGTPLAGAADGLLDCRNAIRK